MSTQLQAPALPPTEPTPRQTIRWFEELTAADTELVGGKGANLGELTSFGLPVPPGFVATADAYRRFLESAGITDELRGRVEALDVDDTEALKKAAVELQKIVREAPIPTAIEDAVRASYHALGRRCEATEPFVAVRSSATAEDMPGTSFAGMNETYLNVKGEEGLIEAVRQCWVSLYSPRVLFYRRKQGIAEEKMAIAVVVQMMVDSISAGVMFTVDPANAAS
jgi:pyruvate, water dikinase